MLCPSPCVTLPPYLPDQPETALCSGCGRTLDEIACWGSMTDAEKAPVWTRIEQAGYLDIGDDATP